MSYRFLNGAVLQEADAIVRATAAGRALLAAGSEVGATTTSGARPSSVGRGFGPAPGKLQAQFDAICPLDDGKTCINGKLTLGENIADLGGLATAYDAMKKATDGQPDPKTDGLTRDQRFFLNWATVWRRNFTPENLAVRLKTDPHAPANFRAIGAPSNLPAFAAAFQCKAGDPMVRADGKQVVIW